MASRRSKGTIRARASASEGLGSGTARATCSASDREYVEHSNAESETGHVRRSRRSRRVLVGACAESPNRLHVDTALVELGDALLSRTANANGTMLHYVRGGAGPASRTGGAAELIVR